MNIFAPIVIFVYKRTIHLDRLIQSLKQNELSKHSELIVFSDGHKKRKDKREVLKVREYLTNIDGFSKITIYESDKNMGLANSIIYGVSKVLDNFENIIVLEDDLEVSNNFLKYMNDSLEFFKNNQRIFSISGLLFNGIEIPINYNYDTFAHPRLSSTGWATWRNRWHKADWGMTYIDEFIKNPKMQNDFNTLGNNLSNMLIRQNEGKIDSWAIRWIYTHFVNDALSIFPTISKVIHIGDDESGTHVNRPSRIHRPRLDTTNQMEFNFFENIELNSEIKEQFKELFD